MKEFHLNEPDSKIIFLDDREQVFIYIATSCPFEGGLNGATGYRYDAIKDYIRWNSDYTIDVDEIYKAHIPTFLQLGTYLASELKSNHK